MAEGELLLSFQVTLSPFFSHWHYHLLLLIAWAYNLDVILTLDFPLCSEGCVDTFPIASPRHGLSRHLHDQDAVQALSSHVLSPAASFPRQTQPWPTTVHPTCCYTHCFSRPSLLITFTTHLFPGLPWLPASTPCFMPGSYRRALRQGPPRLCVSAASGS